MIELTALAKSGGPLTKRIYLNDAGKVISDGSACVMGAGSARRMQLSDLHAFAEFIGALGQNEALALGALRADLPGQAEVVTKTRLDALNGEARPDLIARTGAHIAYRQGKPALALIDFDVKGLPGEVKARLKEAGGFWAALVSVIPALADTGRVMRRSTSSGLFRTDTGEAVPGSDGVHAFLHVRDGADIDRFLKTLHARCWLAGFGWLMVGAGGQLLERSIVDRMVGAPERLVFEGAPVTEAPLAQDATTRRPEVTEGGELDTIAACPPLTVAEQARLRELLAKEAARLAPERAKARESFIAEQAKSLAARTGMSLHAAQSTIERQCAGILLPSLVLPFDDPELAGATVGDVLADPGKFEGATLADPLEGTEYGACKAKIMRRADGSPWINSFAHGRTVYELKLDARAMEAELAKAPANEAAALFVKLALAADLDAEEQERLRDIAAKAANVGKRAIDAKLKAARQAHAKLAAQEARDRKAAERKDTRPQIEAPSPDAPWLPQMAILNDVLGKSDEPVPPMRDVEGFVTRVRERRVHSLHLLTSGGANDGDSEETRLPPPEEPLLTRLDEVGVGELIERYIEFVEGSEQRPVHLAAPFVKHFMRRDDDALPTVTGIATLPIVLPSGSILTGQGLDRKRGVVLQVPRELEALIPNRKDCTATAVAHAMQFLTDEWLCDVATDYEGKCVLIALALTIIERAALPERPAFFVSAGQRSSGKTTVVNMASMAVRGRRAGAAAWSPNEEERRKALFSYLGDGVSLLVWDNIPRATAISCASIEKALTAESYTDRILGTPDNKTVPASTIMAFTGNNIAPRGDMASRSLTARLNVERPDPENRPFRHQDPIGWTEANRGRILASLYTILLGNPRLAGGNHAPAETRFKMWWHLVGSAIEYAARQHRDCVAALVMDAANECKPAAISFRQLFLAGEADEEQTTSLATVLDVLRTQWPSGFKAIEVARFADEPNESAIAFRAAIEQATGKAVKVVTPTTITWRLKALVGAPVQVGDAVLNLRYLPDSHGGSFAVRATG